MSLLPSSSRHGGQCCLMSPCAEGIWILEMQGTARKLNHLMSINPTVWGCGCALKVFPTQALNPASDQQLVAFPRAPFSFHPFLLGWNRLIIHCPSNLSTHLTGCFFPSPCCCLAKCIHSQRANFSVWFETETSSTEHDLRWGQAVPLSFSPLIGQEQFPLSQIRILFHSCLGFP